MDSIHVDLVAATKTKSNEYLIEEGDVARIEKRDPEPLYVFGLVTHPKTLSEPCLFAALSMQLERQGFQ